MLHQAPAGARDWLPVEVMQKQWLSQKLEAVFSQWGYQQIITSTLEWVETLTAGGAIDPATVIPLQDGSEKPLGLRPEFTASIARASVTRMQETPLPQRLFYNGNVFRSSQEHHGEQMESYQAGVELIGATGVLADSEIILLLSDCLQAVGIEQWHLILGEAGLTRSLLAPFPENLREKVRYCIAHLDRVSLEQLPLSRELQERALLLFDLRGTPETVLEKVSQLKLDATGKNIVTNLKSLLNLLSETASFSLTLDLSLLQTIDYYTGIVFEVVAETERETCIIGQGGRYDQLLGLYHPQGENLPGIGFALNLEQLQTCLLRQQKLPETTPASDWLIIPENVAAQASALNYAQQLRENSPSLRVELALEETNASNIRNYAQQKGINRLAWLKADGNAVVEEVEG
ncbi:MAG: ATP phosphoribosyltransferase regulatory subunit [Cyanobacteria bacterium SW_9_44_58]|nr:MAG: ATP phosphoribosyltransferase regulatory subunit [Cyanobacteria bacterium SW_9_44_58]